jgi:hypothetical protein
VGRVDSKFYRPCSCTHLHIGEGSSEFGGVNTTEGQLPVLDRSCSRGLKSLRTDKIGWIAQLRL